jgi:hypothetical protein
MAEMRHRRPHLFSDTERRAEPAVAREVLDYHLETLTRRKQEYEFEHLARLLAEKEICPNLRPQTGPTGGGDAKVDSETYPVAESMAERWYAGDPKAKGERWGFAFSTKEDWAPKVRSDVASAISTNRGYARIYFITSRYAPDKRRSDLEDELTRTAGVPVTILDRTWILEKIYGNDRLELAIEALGLTPDRTVEQERPGPRDAARLRRLEEVDRQIQDANRYTDARYSLAEDCLNSALLARGLERPRAEVEARFRQARRIAEEVGVPNQRLRVLYLEAWTAHWWYEDVGTLLDNYLLMERLVAGTNDADDVEKLAALSRLLAGAVRAGLLDVAKVDLDEHRAFVSREYQRLAADVTRPNTALQAKFGLELIAIENALVATDGDRLEDAWRRMATLAPETEPLLSFPLERTVRLIEDLGGVLPPSDAHEAALDAFLPVLERRRSEAAAGGALLRRGLQRLDGDRPYDAIRLLGRAELRLAKEESREDLIACLLGLALGYDRAGLPWAARTKLLLAADQCFANLRDGGDLPPALVTSLYRLTVAELKLGRIPQTIAAWRHLSTMAAQLELDVDEAEALRNDLGVLDFMLGFLLLRAPASDLRAMERLPDALARAGLPRSRMLLLWALGHEATVRADYIAEDEQDADVGALFRSGLDQPAVRELPRAPLGVAVAPITMTCSALGCEFRLEVADDLASVRVAEAIMSALEAFLATSLAQPVAPWREHLRFSVRLGGPGEGFATTWHDEAAEVWAEVRHPADPHATDDAGRKAFSDWLFELVAQTLARAFLLFEPEAWLKSVAGEEEGFSRAIALGNVPILHSSLFGEDLTHGVEHWITEEDRAYSYRREQPWSHEAPKREGVDVAGLEQRARADSFDHESAPHSRRRVSSVVNLPLWDAAGWRGVGQLVFPDGGQPVLALAFADIAVGARIFEEWRARFGEVDEADVIRVSLIQGLKSAKPAEYAVTISREFGSIENRHPDDTFLMTSRMLRMHPASLENLDRFLAAYARAGGFLLAPSLMRASPTLTDFRLDLGIAKRRLTLRRAWEIGPDDPDLLALQDDDDPIIPDQVEDAPVEAGLARVRAVRSGAEASPFGSTSKWRGPRE